MKKFIERYESVIKTASKRSSKAEARKRSAMTPSKKARRKSASERPTKTASKIAVKRKT